MSSDTITATVNVTTQETGQAALRIFFRIATAWALTNSEQMTLLGVSRTKFFVWKAGKLRCGLDKGTAERLSLIFGIYTALQVLLPIPERADAWIRKPNSSPLFGGESALARMLGGLVSDLYVVRQYLEAQRGGWS